MTTSAFDYSADTNCNFHEELENKNCARGMARRYCYMLSQALCSLFEVAPTATHLPPKREVVTDTFKVELSTVRIAPPNRYYANNDDHDDWAPNSGDSQREDPQSSRQNMVGFGRGVGRGWTKR